MFLFLQRRVIKLIINKHVRKCIKSSFLWCCNCEKYHAFYAKSWGIFVLQNTLNMARSRMSSSCNRRLFFSKWENVKHLNTWIKTKYLRKGKMIWKKYTPNNAWAVFLAWAYLFVSVAFEISLIVSTRVISCQYYRILTEQKHNAVVILSKEISHWN